MEDKKNVNFSQLRLALEAVGVCILAFVSECLFFGVFAPFHRDGVSGRVMARARERGLWMATAHKTEVIGGCRRNASVKTAAVCLLRHFFHLMYSRIFRPHSCVCVCVDTPMWNEKGGRRTS